MIMVVMMMVMMRGMFVRMDMVIPSIEVDMLTLVSRATEDHFLPFAPASAAVTHDPVFCYKYNLFILNKR